MSSSNEFAQAAANRDLKTVELLLKVGAKRNAQDKRAEPPSPWHEKKDGRKQSRFSKKLAPKGDPNCLRPGG